MLLAERPKSRLERPPFLLSDVCGRPSKYVVRVSSIR